MMEYNPKNEKETIELAQKTALRVAPPVVLALHGDLGAGKSVFARAMIRTLTGNHDEDVPSPTFTLVQTYDAPDTIIRHFDLYRLEKPEDVLPLDWDEAMFDGIAIIEWPEKAGAFLPDDRIDIELNIISAQERKIIFKLRGEATLDER